MAASAGTMTVPIHAKIGNKEIHLGDAEVPIKMVGGHPKAPSPRELKAIIRKGLR